MMEQARYLCDQCRTYDANGIDAQAQTWCSRCWSTAARQSAITDALTPVFAPAPFVVEIPVVLALWSVPGNPCPLVVVSAALRRKWAERLDLPQEEEP